MRQLQLEIAGYELLTNKKSVDFLNIATFLFSYLFPSFFINYYRMLLFIYYLNETIRFFSQSYKVLFITSN